MYISMFGCARYPSGQYVVGKKKDLIASGVNKMYRCGEKARAQPTIAGIYWILFILVCSFVMLSLFIGGEADEHLAASSTRDRRLAAFGGTKWPVFEKSP